ncbi:hypothetical protein AGDE_16582 [Angomonas deanei]|nr:hypothetical protein AGDE_16582 [Angomonas deanei]|eukprot:EPY16837.1 hypothetical protein AGDE_16582 [Angomonas deanei]
MSSPTQTFRSGATDEANKRKKCNVSNRIESACRWARVSVRWTSKLNFVEVYSSSVSAHKDSRVSLDPSVCRVMRHHCNCFCARCLFFMNR